MQLMKRLFQFVLFALVLLAAAQPLLTDTACTQQRCGGTPDCYTHLGCMAIPDSAMSSLLPSFRATPHAVFAEAGCSYRSCWLRSNSATLLVATSPIFRLANGSTLLMPVAQFSARPVVILAARSSEDAIAGAVPRNILFHVFRI
jgi:hypothetical protein